MTCCTPCRIAGGSLSIPVPIRQARLRSAATGRSSTRTSMKRTASFGPSHPTGTCIVSTRLTVRRVITTAGRTARAPISSQRERQVQKLLLSTATPTAALVVSALPTEQIGPPTPASTPVACSTRTLAKPARWSTRSSRCRTRWATRAGDT